MMVKLTLCFFCSALFISSFLLNYRPCFSVYFSICLGFLSSVLCIVETGWRLDNDVLMIMSILLMEMSNFLIFLAVAIQLSIIQPRIYWSKPVALTLGLSCLTCIILQIIFQLLDMTFAISVTQITYAIIVFFGFSLDFLFLSMVFLWQQEHSDTNLGKTTILLFIKIAILMSLTLNWNVEMNQWWIFELMLGGCFVWTNTVLLSLMNQKHLF
jgi:hypothetical protein